MRKSSAVALNRKKNEFNNNNKNSISNSNSKKRKKKGRPSLLDLHRRSLRLERLNQPDFNSNSISNNSKPNPNPNSEDDDDDDDDPRPKERKLRHVLQEGSQNSSKGTERFEGDPQDRGPTTPLPDKKLLVFILDRLQKKDTYGVFSEPPDPEELPDYHDIIKHPMDFGTIRKKLDDGAYECLEQFEEDVILISSNAMAYNSPDTIYYRQARSIQELAKKDFENLRQASDDSEPESKTVGSRGRPPNKSNIKPTAGQNHLGNATSPLKNFNDVSAYGTQWCNSNDNESRGGMKELSLRSSNGVRGLDALLVQEHSFEKEEEYSGSAVRGTKRVWKKAYVPENRRKSYRKAQAPICLWEQPIFTTFDRERKVLVPVGLHSDHAYARSLARFAAKLGPVGWEIAAKKIQGVLPPGTKFGPGWIGEDEVAQQFPTSEVSTCFPHPAGSLETSSAAVVKDESRSSDSQQ